jgi:hypothetical protein
MFKIRKNVEIPEINRPNNILSVQLMNHMFNISAKWLIENKFNENA